MILRVECLITVSIRLGVPVRVQVVLLDNVDVDSMITNIVGMELCRCTRRMICGIEMTSNLHLA